MTPSITDAPPALDVEVERLPGSEARLTVVAPREEVDRGIGRALTQLAGQVRLPGFRPGKAPAAVVERAVGWAAVQQETIDIILPELYERAVHQVELEPVAQPQISPSELQRGEPFSFVVTVGVKPEVQLGDYRSIRVPLEHKDVPEEDVEGTLTALRQRYAQLTDAGDRPVEAGDVVTAQLTMHHNGEVVGTAGQEQSLDLERGELLPGMADQLLGAVAGGDPVEISLTLPEEYAREELRGELVTITAVVTRVQAKELPELDDNLAAIAGHGETLEELRAFIKDQLAADLLEEAERAQASAALEALIGMTKAEVPEALEPVPIGRAATLRPGRDLTLVSYGAAVHTCMAAADVLAGEGVEAEVIDLRSVQPWDEAAVLNSLQRTHRLVVVHEAVEAFGIGAEIAARMADAGFDELDGPILRVGAPFMPVPFSKALERAYIPSADAVVQAARRVLA